MNEQQLLALIRRYEAGQCSEDERVLLQRWYAQRAADGGVDWKSEEERLSVKQLMHGRIEAKLFKPHRGFGTRIAKKMLMAASLIFVLSTTVWLYLNKAGNHQQLLNRPEQAVSPGSQVAFLTLADGSTIRLDEAHKELLHDKNGVAIQKLDGGELRYETEANSLLAESDKIFTNTIHVPKGGQYRVTLPDGTKVSLNSASTLTYPNRFLGNERKVTLSGEGYFEVAKNKNMPFKVKAGDTEIQVTGTRFNMQAYDDEQQTTTTLVEGSVHVLKNDQKVTLKPGYQAISHSSDSRIDVESVDTDYALAWLQGDFVFENQDLQTIMKNIARWYNLEIIYESKVPPRSVVFGGTYTKSKGIEELLSHLEALSNDTIRFKLTERRLFIMM